MARPRKRIARSKPKRRVGEPRNRERRATPPGPPERPEHDPSRKLPPPHVGRAVRGCRCGQCQEHRRLNRQEERDYRMAIAAGRSWAPLTTYTTSAALADALCGTVIFRG